MCYTHTVVCLYFTSGGSSILFEYKSIFACALFKSENSVMFVWENTDVFQHRLYKLAWCKTDFAYTQYGASQMTQLVKNLLANAGDLRDAGSVPQLGRRPGKGNGSMLQYSSLENSMHGEPGGLQSMGSQRIRHDWVHERAHTHTHTRCINRKPHPVEPGKVRIHISKHTQTWNTHLQPQLMTEAVCGKPHHPHLLSQLFFSTSSPVSQ